MIDTNVWLELDDERVSVYADHLEHSPIAMSDMVIKWGRAAYFGDADPLRLTVTLWDATSQWAVRIRDGRALGVHGRAGWTSDATGDVTMFRGTVVAAEADMLDRTMDDGRNVWAVTLTLADPSQALGAVYPLPGILNAKYTYASYKAWLLGLCAYGGLVLTDIDYDNRFAPALLSPNPVGEDSALDLITKFYGSMGDTFTYDAEANRLRQCLRMADSFTTSLASFDDSRGAVMITAGDYTRDSRTSPGVALSACQLRVPDGVTLTAATSTDINRVEMTYEMRGSSTVPNDYERQDDSYVASEDRATHDTRRLFKFDAITWQSAYSSIAMQDVFKKARNEGRRPAHPPLTFKPGKTFATERMARWWLRTWEDGRPGFINGDAAHAWLMAGSTRWSPLVSPLGGTITWNGTTGWSIAVDVQWMQDDSAVTPMTWTNLRQYKWTSTAPIVPWWWTLLGLPMPPAKKTGDPVPERDVRWGAPDGDTAQYRFDESVTWSDLMHLDNTTREIKDILQ